MAAAIPEDVGVGERSPAFDVPCAATPDSLEALITHLQGNGPEVMADAGIARLHPERLAALQRGAQLRAESCLQNAQALSCLLGDSLQTRDLAPPADQLARVARHINQLMHDHERWRQLADHASMYQRQRDVAMEVFRRWQRWACHWNEWPSPTADH